VIVRSAIVALALAAPALAQPAGDLNAVKAHFTTARTMTAAFSQTDRKGATLDGTLTIKQPGQIRFNYGRGVPMTVVADGRNLYFVDYQVKQVSRWPIRNSPLAAILDPARDIGRYATLMPVADTRIVSVQIYSKSRPEYGKINLVFTRQAGAPGGLSLSGWVALDAQGNRTTVRLSNQRYNGPVSDEAFRWDDPRKKPAAR
jgi:outer membrane lipoprotein-sorting protein